MAPFRIFQGERAHFLAVFGQSDVWFGYDARNREVSVTP